VITPVLGQASRGSSSATGGGRGAEAGAARWAVEPNAGTTRSAEGLVGDSAARVAGVPRARGGAMGATGRPAPGGDVVQDSAGLEAAGPAAGAGETAAELDTTARGAGSRARRLTR
jgi:hypothetical protein